MAQYVLHNRLAGANHRFSDKDVRSNLHALADSPVMLEELTDLLRYQLDQIDFIDHPARLPYDCPLDVHCSYTRDQLLVALGFMSPRTLREGVKYLKEKKTDVLLITLHKSDKDYSPTTLYQDYAVSPRLFTGRARARRAPNPPPVNGTSTTEGRAGTSCCLCVSSGRMSAAPRPIPFLARRSMSATRVADPWTSSGGWKMRFRQSI